MVSSTPANPPAHPQAQAQPQSSLFQDVYILADEDWPIDEWHERCHILVPLHLHRSVLVLDSCTSICVSGDLLGSSEAPPSSPSASASAPASPSPSPSVATSAPASSPFLDGDRVMDVLSHEGFWAEGDRAVFRRRVDGIMALAPNTTVFPRVTTLTPDGPPPPSPADDTPVIYLVRSLEPAGSVAMDLGWRAPIPLRVGDAVFVDLGRDEVLTGAGYVVDKYDVDPDSVARMFARLGRPVPGTARRKRDDTDKKDDTDKDAKNDKNDPPPPSSGTGTGEPSNNEPGPNTTASSAKDAPDHYPSLTPTTTITAATKTTADAQAQHDQSDALNPPEGAVPPPEAKPEDNPEGKIKELPIVIQSLDEAFLENRRRIEQEPIPVRPPVRRRREVVLHPEGMVFTDRDRELADMWVLMK